MVIQYLRKISTKSISSTKANTLKIIQEKEVFGKVVIKKENSKGVRTSKKSILSQKKKYIVKEYDGDVHFRLL